MDESILHALTDKELALAARRVNAEVRKREKQFRRQRRTAAIRRIEALLASAGMSWDDVHRMAS